LRAARAATRDGAVLHQAARCEAGLPSAWGLLARAGRVPGSPGSGRRARAPPPGAPSWTPRADERDEAIGSPVSAAPRAPADRRPATARWMARGRCRHSRPATPGAIHYRQISSHGTPSPSPPSNAGSTALLPQKRLDNIEAPRVYRMLHSLRGWGHDTENQVFARGPGTGCPGAARRLTRDRDRSQGVRLLERRGHHPFERVLPDWHRSRHVERRARPRPQRPGRSSAVCSLGGDGRASPSGETSYSSSIGASLMKTAS
jgi:hypothetical protein